MSSSAPPSSSSSSSSAVTRVNSRENVRRRILRTLFLAIAASINSALHQSQSLLVSVESGIALLPSDDVLAAMLATRRNHHASNASMTTTKTTRRDTQGNGAAPSSRSATEAAPASNSSFKNGHSDANFVSPHHFAANYPEYAKVTVREWQDNGNTTTTTTTMRPRKCRHEPTMYFVATASIRATTGERNTELRQSQYAPGICLARTSNNM